MCRDTERGYSGKASTMYINTVNYTTTESYFEVTDQRPRTPPALTPTNTPELNNESATMLCENVWLYPFSWVMETPEDPPGELRGSALA